MNNPLITVNASGAQTPLFCIPGVGGVAWVYISLGKRLTDRPLYGLEAVGLSGDDDPCTTVEAMAERYEAAVREKQPHGPYLLAGHSFGGQVALETALRLERAGERVSHLFLFDSAPPGSTGGNIEWEDTALAIAFVGGLGLDVNRDEKLLKAFFATESLEAYTFHMMKALKAWQLIPENVDQATVADYFDVFRINNRINYQPTAKTNATITLIRARQFVRVVSEPEGVYEAYGHDPKVVAKMERATAMHRAFNEQLAEKRQKPDMDWGRHSHHPIRVQEVAGDHMSLIMGDNAANIAQIIQATLAEDSKARPTG